jgi:hypothetical protein
VWKAFAGWLTSHATLYWLSWIGVVAALLAVLALVWALLSIVRDFDEAHLIRQQRGPKAKRARTIRRNIGKYEDYARHAVRTIALRTTGLLLVGIGLPGLILAVIADEAVLLIDGQPASAHDQSITELGVFVLDQALRGGLSDAFEVFGLQLSAFQNNPGNILFSSFTLGYRLICGLIFAAILYVIGRVVLGYRNLNAAIAELKAELETAS